MAKKRPRTPEAQVKFYLGITEGKYMQFIRRKMMVQQGRRCAICGGIIENEDDATLDHILPRAHGGATVASNLQLAHRECNLKKGNKIVIDY